MRVFFRAARLATLRCDFYHTRLKIVHETRGRDRPARMLPQTVANVFPVFTSRLACPSAAWIITMLRPLCRLITFYDTNLFFLSKLPPEDHENWSMNQLSLQHSVNNEMSLSALCGRSSRVYTVPQLRRLLQMEAAVGWLQRNSSRSEEGRASWPRRSGNSSRSSDYLSQVPLRPIFFLLRPVLPSPVLFRPIQVWPISFSTWASPTQARPISSVKPDAYFHWKVELETSTFDSKDANVMPVSEKSMGVEQTNIEKDFIHITAQT